MHVCIYMCVFIFICMYVCTYMHRYACADAYLHNVRDGRAQYENKAAAEIRLCVYLWTPEIPSQYTLDQPDLQPKTLS